jgi:hypothetical protein
MKKLFLFLFSFGLLISTSATAEIVLYCNGELATGLIKKNGIWGTGDFKTERYTIKFSDDYSEVKGLEEIIGGDGSLQCKDAFPNIFNTVVCRDGNGTSFTYNKNTKRFVLFTGVETGFLINGNDTTTIQAGTCQKF